MEIFAPAFLNWPSWFDTADDEDEEEMILVEEEGIFMPLNKELGV